MRPAITFFNIQLSNSRDNGADMYKYNTLYTARYTQHVLSPEYLYTILSPHNFLGKLLLLISGKYIIMFS